MNLSKRLLFLLLFFINTDVYSADIPALAKLFSENYHAFYKPRFCGQNIAQFLKEANRKNIDLSNSTVLKIVGGGFLETSGFCTRYKPNEREMLGYFHMVFVANGVVFDFDLNGPKVLTIEDYVRLQFTPAYEPYMIFGINYSDKGNPGNWDLTSFKTLDYLRGIETVVWKKKLKNYIDIDYIYSLQRFNCTP